MNRSTELLLAIIEAYTQAEQQLLERIARELGGGPAANEPIGGWQVRKLANLGALRRHAERVLAQLQKEADPLVRELLLKEFLAGAGGVTASSFFSTTGAAASALIGEFLGLLGATRFRLLRATLDGFRSAVAATVVNVTLGTSTRKQAAKQALGKLAAEGLTAFVDRTGRRWEVESYVEMATRTAAQNAFREGRVASVVAAGGDLVVIRSSPSRCPRCEPWRNKVVSVSGSDSRFPSLDTAKSAGVFHPGCRCTIARYVPGLTSLDTVEKVPNYYEAEQDQRRLERAIRKQKRVLAVDPENEKAKRKLSELRAELRTLVEETPGLRRKPEREGLGAR